MFSRVFVVDNKSLRANDVQHLVNELSLAALFTLLVASSHQESLTESVHTICRNYLVTLPTSELLRPEFYHYFLIGLQSNQPAAVHLALDQLSRIDFEDPSNVDSSMATAIAGHLGDESLNVSQAVANLVKKFFVNAACLSAFLDAPEVVASLQRLLASPKYKMRVVQVIFDCLALTTLESLHCGLLKQADLISPIFFTHDNDPLLRLNLLETFGQHINAPVPRSLVNEFRVVEEVAQGLDAFLSSQDLDSVALKGELKFLVDAFLGGFEIPRLHDTLKSCLISDSLALQDIGLQVTTLIFDAPVGAKLMRGSAAFLRAVTQLCAASGQTKVDALACVATLVGVSVNPDPEITDAAQLAYDLLGESMVLPQGLVALARNPSSDIKGPAYALLLHLTYHPFGVKHIINSPPVVSFLLDRGADSTMLGQKWKYGVIESLSRRILTLKDTSGCEDICSPELQRQFSKYVREGVVYSDSTPSVALESS
ncbi:hypothetical protein DSO57_1034655 [Entomophthora muscae]|uniref:Uncharacterized protein n=1 Tax=Entomophthora muscae TaxID=34485 RepID=A0ACC2T012_9FUNG|nr:hypothetical protein DSO57_1034655 [Entomophthora muscae]